MSNSCDKRVICSHCGKESEFTVWSTINTEDNPHMKQAVRDRSAFFFTCPDCGEVMDVDYGCLYHEVESKLMIYYVQDAQAFTMAEKLFRGQKVPGQPALPDETDYLYRIVVSQNQLVEKLAIFDAGCDDRIIECLKIIYASRIQSQKPELKADDVFFFTDNEGINRLMFTSGSKCVATVALNGIVYQTACEQFGTGLPDIRQDDIVIDSAWALRWVQNVGLFKKN